MFMGRAHACVALLATLSMAACGGDPKVGSGFALQLVSASGQTPERFRVIVSEFGVARRSIDCPSAEGDSSPRCTDNGVELGQMGQGSVVTVKAAGYSFVTRALDKVDVERSAMQLALAALPPNVANAHYCTGLDQESGEAAFLDLAVNSDTELGPAHSVKFYIGDLNDSPTVYLQNTSRYPLHYDFVHSVLGIATSPAEFASKTYDGEDRNAMAGTLTYYPELAYQGIDMNGAATAHAAPVALEFFPSDSLSPELALRAHRLLEERMLWLYWQGADRRLTYLPASSSHEQALDNDQERFAMADALFASHVDFYSGVSEQRLNPGIAYGTLRLLTPEELAKTVVSFRDIALLARQPNDVPLLGGTITEELQTPLAHVNLAARARGTPNLALREASTDPRVSPYLGKLVRLEVTRTGFSIDEVALSEAEAFWNAQKRETVVPQADVTFGGLPSFEELKFADFIRVGTKAANLAELRQLLGDEAAPGFAVPFSAYEKYMAQNLLSADACSAASADCMVDGREIGLCEAAHARCQVGADAQESFYGFVDRLLGDAEFTTNSALREACLDGLRFLMEHGIVDPAFAAALDARVAELFGGLQVRLRSSTNGEDLPGFSGAGLYESFSASASAAPRASERIRSVWASVWLWRAFEERQFWNVDQRALRMAVAVNPAVDDEAGNGVLITQNLAQPGALGYYVNAQRGEVEVTNPPSGALPEVLTLIPTSSERIEIVRQRFSSLSPTAPILTDTELAALYRAAERVEAHFAPLYQQAPSTRALDLEFKFHGANRQLLIKQARPYSEE